MDILTYQNFYLVGLKGVAMTSLAQCLLDAGKKVSGSDVAENFVTQGLLAQLPLKIDTDFAQPIPDEVDCLIYTAAHHGKNNPQVQAAIAKNIPVYSQAEALGSLFNQKQGIAVCGVGGKSTVSAMIAWILSQISINNQPSFSIGVGNIPGLNKTGQWRASSQYFVAEADEYVTNPEEIRAGEPPQPRFSYLQPFITVCTNIKFDHPDVYRDFEQTVATFKKFFQQIKAGGKLIMNADDQSTYEEMFEFQGSDLPVEFFGETPAASWQLTHYKANQGLTQSKFIYQDQIYELSLQIPGQYNALNALAAIAACQTINIPIDQSIQALAKFNSTMRRFEHLGQKNGVEYYDDYAHHPSELRAVIKAIQEWYPDRRIVIAFQPHTYSRTKQLFAEFAAALTTAPEVILLDIFASARENFDPTINCDQLVKRVKQLEPQTKISNLKTIENLAKFCQTELKSGDVLITLGAGDIYQVHDLL